MLWSRVRVLPFIIGFASPLLACGGARPPAATSSPPPPSPAVAPAPTSPDDEPPAGHITRATVQALPKWTAAKGNDETNPDADAARALKDVPAGATVRVFLGTWCGDSRREVTRFWIRQFWTCAPRRVMLVQS